MKKLSVFILLLPIALILSSCSQSFYQFPIFESENTKLDKFDELTLESDNIEVGFSFYGHDTPLQIRIYNRSSENIQIDWENAYVSINGQVYQMYSEMSKTWICNPSFKSSVDAASDTLSITEFEALVIQHGEKSFGDNSNELLPNHTLIFNSIELQKDTLNLQSYNEQKNLDDFLFYQFNTDNTPMNVKVYFPIYRNNKAAIEINESFWISGIYSIKQKQFKTPYLHKKSMNMATLYTYKEKRALLSSAYYLSSVVVGTVAIWMSRGATFDPDEIEN